MRCLVVVLSVVACVGTAAAAAAGCSLAEEFSARHNATADDGSAPGPICGGQCCGRGRETNLRASLQRLASRRVSTSLRPVAELLLATRRTLQEHLIALSHQSQNKTALLFTQVYRGHPARAQVPLAALYEDIRALLRAGPDRDVMDDVTAAPPRDLVLSARKFFRDVFPVVYHVVLKLDGKQFTPEYEACLKDAYDAVQPFDEVPQQVESSLSKSLEAARALLQVLAVGAAALGTSEQILTSANPECSDRLMRLAGCARCRNHAVAPCRSYCLNVARGCIGSLVSELEAPWAGYVEGVERVARADADAALRALDEHVSKAIMHAIENHVMLEKKVRQECGPPSTTALPGLPTPRPTPGAARRDALRAPPPDTELLQFAASLAATKKLFFSLADRVCEEPDFAHDGNEMCWNGEAIGQYSKPLVASASLSDQRYNPEVPGGATPDQRVSALGHQLRQARQWDLVCNRKYLLSLVQPLTQTGILLGNLGFGILADRIGRKIPLMIAVVLQAIFMLITSFMPLFPMFLAFKTLSAIATGGTMLISFVIVIEIIGTEVRSKVLTLYHVPFVLGILTVPLFSHLTRTYDGYWLMISLPSCLLLSYHWLIPESPRWLLAVGRVEQARKILLKAAKTNKISERKVTAAIESHEALIPSAIKKIDTTEKQKSYGVMDLIRTPNMRLKTICIVFNWLKCGMVFFGIEHYLGHMSDNVLSDLAISAAFQLLGLLIVFVLISRVSRLKILIVANVLAGISLLLIIPFYNSDIAKLVLVTVALTCMTISFPTIFLYTGELFPTVVRNIGFAVCSVASKTGSIFAPFLIDYVDDLAYWVIPVVFGMGPILGAILCIWLPETMNCKLPETIEDGENFKRNKEKKPAASPI